MAWTVLDACGVWTKEGSLAEGRLNFFTHVARMSGSGKGSSMVFKRFGFGRKKNLVNDHELRRLIAEIDMLTAMEDWPRRVQVCEQVLSLISRHALPAFWARMQKELADSIIMNPLGDRAENLERAIGCYQIALQVFTRETRPVDWARVQHNLGNAYQWRVRGDRSENLEMAIGCCQAAFQIFTRETQPVDWARTHYNLGNIYLIQDRGDRGENLERVIDCCQTALQVFSQETWPVDWALAQHNLGSAYLDRVRGNPAENLETAIDCFHAALEVRTRDMRPVDWAGTQNNLGLAYLDRVQGDRSENLENAVACFQTALQVRTRQALPADWARTQNGLGSAYRERVRGNRAENLEKAIDHHQEALQVLSLESWSVDWAATQIGLGNAYQARVRGDRAQNLETAIACFQAALRVHTRETRPADRARTQHNLGNAYADRIRGDRTENLEESIAYYQAALSVSSREVRPADRAITQGNLGGTYLDRVRGDRAENVETAIACIEAALQVLTRETLPAGWAMTQANRGSAYRVRVRGDRAENVETAIACFEAALQVRTRETLPAGWAMTQHRLGNAYRHRVRGDGAENQEKAIAYFQATLQVYTREAWPADWAINQHNLGAAYGDRVRGDRSLNLETAIGCLQAALEIYQSDTRPNDSKWTAQNLGHVCSMVRRWRDAASAYRIALDATETLYQASLLASSRQAELAESDGIAIRAAYALARSGEVGEAVVVLERGRARELGDALDRDRADLAEVARCDPEGYEIYRRAGERLRTIDAADRRSEVAGDRIAASAGDGTGEAGQRARRVAEKTLADEARAAVAELATAMERIRRIPGFETFLAQPDLDTVVTAVEASTPLAYLVCVPAGTVTLLVHHAVGMGLAVEAIWAEGFAGSDLSALLITSEGDEVTGGFLPGQLGAQDCLEKALTEGLPLLGERLAGPLAARLGELGATGVVLVPCGALGLLPLHAASYHRGETLLCLLDEFDVSYAPSARVLTTARSAARARDGLAPVLAGVGNPLPHPSPLAFARAELEEVVACFRHSYPLYEKAATKEALLDAAAGATHIHLSCHGLYDPTEPLSSQLQLANLQPLSLGEILTDRPFADARLVVASACQTAITDFDRLPDEAIGLPAGFLSAGTPGVVGTLWPVNDLSTALLMSQFYRYHLHGDPTTGRGPMAPARALRGAQRWLARVSAGELYKRFVDDPVLQAALSQVAAARLPEALAAMGAARFGLDDRDARPFAHPYHWAPFIFVGA